jgi:hypothetical protein
MYFEEVHQWQGTADALTRELKRQIEQLGLSIEPPALRTVRSWRAKQLLSQPKGQEFGFRQILEGLATALLLKKGWTISAIAQVLPSFPEDALERQIIAEADGQDPTWSPALQQLLCHYLRDIAKYPIWLKMLLSCWRREFFANMTGFFLVEKLCANRTVCHPNSIRQCASWVVYISKKD